MKAPIKASDSFAVGDYVQLRPEAPPILHARWSMISWGDKLESMKGKIYQVAKVDDYDCTVAMVDLGTLADVFDMNTPWADTDWVVKVDRAEIDLKAARREGERQREAVQSDYDALLAMQLRNIGLSNGILPVAQWKVGDQVRFNGPGDFKNKVFSLVNAAHYNLPDELTVFVSGVRTVCMVLPDNLTNYTCPTNELTWVARPAMLPEE